MAYDRAALEAQLRIDEGCLNRPYRDSRGIWTAGIGHNLEAHAIDPASLPIPIPDDMIEGWFQEDIDDAEDALDGYLVGWRDFSDNRQMVACNLAFNMGIKTLLTFKNMIAAMLAGDWNAAATDLLASKYATQVGARAQRLADLIRKG